ncbi:hypothetical protein ACJRPK_13795 [Aquimarina sp. 2-A2]|uniref:hypothetical protein n=1 Tax=Aquimarina sp. 2-A2 TaxID=3382644 RepID=UPI00387F200E
MRNWNKVGNAILWLLGCVIFIAQGFKLIKYYFFDSTVKMDAHDLILLVCGIGLMFLQTVLKDKAKQIIKNANPLSKNK